MRLVLGNNKMKHLPKANIVMVQNEVVPPQSKSLLSQTANKIVPPL